MPVGSVERRAEGRQEVEAGHAELHEEGWLVARDQRREDGSEARGQDCQHDRRRSATEGQGPAGSGPGIRAEAGDPHRREDRGHHAVHEPDLDRQRERPSSQEEPATAAGPVEAACRKGSERRRGQGRGVGHGHAARRPELARDRRDEPGQERHPAISARPDLEGHEADEARGRGAGKEADDLPEAV